MIILQPDNHDAVANEIRLIKRNQILSRQVEILSNERDSIKAAYQRYADFWIVKLIKKLKKN